MRKSSLFFKSVILAGLLCTVSYSCKKVNGINNNTVIETPFSLYFSDTAGTLYNSNDGTTRHTIFPADGTPSRSLCISANNILFVKKLILFSANNGVNFNHSFDSLQGLTKVGCDGRALTLNQSMIIDMPDWNKVFTTSGIIHDPTGTGALDYLGVEISNNHGVPGSWYANGGYDTSGRVGFLPVNMISYTRLTNGVLAGLAINRNQDAITGAMDTIHFRNFYRACGNDEDYACSWRETTGSGIGGAGDTSGSPLPPNYTDTLPAFFTLGHYNNRLIAVDQMCHHGAWYSDDTGRSWLKYAGLPANTSLLCVASPFEQVCLIGTYGAGLYILNVNTQSFQQNNNGLGKNLVVRSIAAKENVYKNGIKKRYIYLATNQGIYQSSDDGINWVKTIAGNYVSIY
jgi:hypothetical protein